MKSGIVKRCQRGLPAKQRASRDRLLHFVDDGLSVPSIALALEQTQATPDNGEKVIDVVDDEPRRVHYRPHPRPPASGGSTSRVGPRTGVAQNPRDLAVGHEELDLHAPGRDEAATTIADAPHPRAERTLHYKRDARAVHEHDDILQRRAFDRARERNADCLFDPHVDLLDCDRSTERRLRPLHEGARRWLED
jgi:hypothetical protein